MNKSDQNFHGSDLEKIESKYGIHKNEIINFSGNVNPLGLSQNLLTQLSKRIELIANYPDREYTDLKNQISLYAGAPTHHIVVGNGSTELISLFIKVSAPKHALIIGPTYSEYEREISINGGSPKYYPLDEKNDFKINVTDLKNHITPECDLLVICNPNNPTSSAFHISELRMILDYCLEQNVAVMIDETYIEFTDIPTTSAVSLTEFYTNLFIIRGVSKFYSAPGLRLGYGICGNLDTVREIKKLKNPWTINSLASYAGELLLSDTDYISKSRKLIESERKRIFDTLNSWDSVHAYKPEANFILVKILKDNINSTLLFEHLIKKRLLIRDASNFPFLSNKYFRFCFLNKEDNDRLLTELDHLLNAKA